MMGKGSRNASVRKSGKVAKFPLAKFKRFLAYLKIHSRDYGVISSEYKNLLGTQRYILDEIVSGLDEGITTFVILKGRQQGSTTLFQSIDLFYALEYPGILGTFILHEEKVLAKWRAMFEGVIKSMPVRVRLAGFERAKRFRPLYCSTTEA